MTTAALQAPLGQASGPAMPRTGPLDSAGIDTVLEHLAALPVDLRRSPGRAGARREGARRVLAWLAQHDGGGWQQRWQHAGADFDTSWIADLAGGSGSSGRCPRETVTEGVTTLLLGRIVLPDYAFFSRYRTTALVRCAKQLFGAEAFAAVARAGKAAGYPDNHQADAERTLVKIVLHTGRDLPVLTAADLLDMRDWHLAARRKIAPGLHAAWDVLRETGVLSEPLPLRRMDQRQLTTTQLVDRYQVRCAPVRQALIRKWTSAVPHWTTAPCWGWPHGWSATSGPTWKPTTPASTPCAFSRRWPKHGGSASPASAGPGSRRSSAATASAC